MRPRCQSGTLSLDCVYLYHKVLILASEQLGGETPFAWPDLISEKLIAQNVPEVSLGGILTLSKCGPAIPPWF